jgi:hypothetical protein
MTARVELLPSPFDRLDPVAAAVRWWTAQMLDVAGRPRRVTVSPETLSAGAKVRGKHVAISLADTDIFVARLVLPKGPAAAHEKALKLRLADIAPIDPNRLRTVASAAEVLADGSHSYAVAMARPERLDDLEKLARKRGVRSVQFHAALEPETGLNSPSAERRRLRRHLVDAGLALLVILSAVSAVTIWTARLEQETQAIASRERDIRRAVVEAEGARQSARIAEELVARGILNRRPSAAIASIAGVNTATPNGAWWTSVRWSPQEIRLSLQSTDAARAIEAISAKAKPWTVELGGSINAAAGAAAQSFDLTLRLQDGPAK